MPRLEDPTLVIALAVATGIAAQIASARLRIPAILPLLLIGFVAGPVLGIVTPDAVFGDLLFPGVSMGVAVILFEGALTLRLADIRGAEQIVLRLITLGVLVTVAVAAAAAHWALEMAWPLAILFGAIVSVSGPTVIVPLLRSMRPTERLSRILHWEGILIDPIGAVLAVIVFEAILAGVDGAEAPLMELGQILASGSLIGGAAGYGLAVVLRRHLIPDFLRNVTTLACVLLVFALTDSLAKEAGLVAVTAMGLTLANLPGVPRDEILDFKESLSVLLISVLFLLLAARIDLTALEMLGPAIGLILCAVLFLARPLSVLVSTIGSGLAWRERALLGWIMPRGIVAAAVAALFGLRLEEAQIAGGELLVPLVFSVIVASVVLHSVTGRPLARLLKVAEPEARGVLIVGGNSVAQAVADSLKELGVRVVLADVSYAQVRQARMAGIRTFFGNPVSEYADRRLDLVGIGVLLALSRQPSLNALAGIRYRSEFGSAGVYTVRRDSSAVDPEARSVPYSFRGRLLFAPEMTLERLEREFAGGKEIRVARLTEDFTFETLSEKLGGADPMLFAVDPACRIHPFAEDATFRVASGWRVAYLATPEDVAGGQSEARGKVTVREQGREVR